MREERDREFDALSPKDIFEEAKDRLQLAIDAESYDRNLAKEDLKFREGDQWDHDIVTTATSETPELVLNFTDPLVRQMALLTPAAVVISGNTTPHAKPHPEPLLEAARRLRIDPSLCWYVGDDERDIVAGKAAGMTVVGILSSHSPSELAEADYTVDNFSQIVFA